MRIDTERIQQYLFEIHARHREIIELLEENTDTDLLKDPWKIKGLKYTLIEIAEAMANTLQHIMAKELGEPVTEYVEPVIRAGEKSVVSEDLSGRLKPFFDFRNSLIHRYWFISDDKLLMLVRTNHSDFLQFIEAIETYIRKRKQASFTLQPPSRSSPADSPG